MFFTLNQRQRPYQWRVRFIKIGAEVKLYIKLLITDLPTVFVKSFVVIVNKFPVQEVSPLVSVRYSSVYYLSSPRLFALRWIRPPPLSTFEHKTRKYYVLACFICVPTLPIGFFENYMFLFLLGSAGSASCCRSQPYNIISRYTPESFACLHNLSDVGRTTTSM